MQIEDSRLLGTHRRSTSLNCEEDRQIKLHIFFHLLPVV